MTKVKILKEFRDKYQFSKMYKVGDEVEDFDEARIADLTKRGLAEVVGVPFSEDINGSKGAKEGIDVSGSVAEIEAAIKEVEDIELLNEALTAEKEGKNRAGAIKAIEARIAVLTKE